MQLEFFNCSPEDFEDYLRDLKDGWCISYLYSTSRYKKEYGCKTALYEYAHFFGYKVTEYATKYSLDERKATGLYYHLVSSMPQYGEEGLKALKEYLEGKGEEYNRNELLILAALLSLDDTGGLLFIPIQDVFHDLFDVEKESNDKEIEFVKMFYHAVQLMKKGDHVDRKEEMEQFALNTIDNNYTTKGAREVIRILKEKADSFEVNEPHFDDKTKEAYFQAILSYEEGSITDYPYASFILHHTDE